MSFEDRAKYYTLPDHPFLVYEYENNRFWCKEHKMWIGPNNVKRHVTGNTAQAHGIEEFHGDIAPPQEPPKQEGIEENLESKPKDPLEEVQEKLEEDDPVKLNQRIKDLENLLKNKQEQQTEQTPEEELATLVKSASSDDIIQQASHVATKIILNTDILFIWRHARHLFPPDWDITAFVEGLFLLGLKEWRVSIKINQNLSQLTPEMVQMMINVTNDWRQLYGEKSQVLA